MLALFAWRFDWLCDDAYISFRYARNLVRGDGLVFDPTSPPVEGYSNLGWVLVAALFQRVGLAVELVRFVSAAAALALIALVARVLSRDLQLARGAVLVAVLFLASLPPLAVWATSGLETVPFALALFALWAFARERPEVAGVAGVAGVASAPSASASAASWRAVAAATAAVAAVLLRADGLAFVLLVAASVAIGQQVDRARRPASPPVPLGSSRSKLGNLGWKLGNLGWKLGNLGWPLLAAFATFALQVAWRIETYDDWLPNTVRAKAALSPELVGRGARYLAVQLATVPALVAALALGVVALRRNPSVAASALLFALGTAAWAVVTGGDFMAMGRFLVPMLPFLALLVGCALDPGPEHRDAAAGTGIGAARALAAAAVLAALSLPAAFDRHLVPEGVRAAGHFRWNSRRYQSEFQTWRDMRQRLDQQLALGRAVGAVAPPGSSLVSGALGGMGWASDLVLLDQNGLVDRAVAREPTSPIRRSPGHDRFVPRSYFAARQPTYAAASLIELATGELVPPEHWDGDVPPERAPDRYLVEVHVRSDAPGPRVRALERLGWVVRTTADDAALPPGFALRLVRWR